MPDIHAIRSMYQRGIGKRQIARTLEVSQRTVAQVHCDGVRRRVGAADAAGAGAVEPEDGAAQVHRDQRRARNRNGATGHRSEAGLPMNIGLRHEATSYPPAYGLRLRVRWTFRPWPSSGYGGPARSTAPIPG